MKNDLAWRDAMAVAGREFSREAQLAGWPERMTLRQVAVLQRPYDSADNAGRNLAASLHRALADACQRGEIDHTTTTESVEVSQAIHTPAVSREFLGGTLAVQPAVSKPAKFKDVTRQHVSPGAVATWLASQGEAPSKHVAAWCKAFGEAVGCKGSAADVVQLRAVHTETKDPTTWTELVAFRKLNKEAPYTVAHKQIIKNEKLRRLNIPGATGVAKSMAAELGMTTQRLGELIRNAGEVPKREAARKKA